MDNDGRKFVRNNTISKEAFLAQFEIKTTVITVQIRSAWRKGARAFPMFDKESLANVEYLVPWLEAPEGPLGAFGGIYWFTKKSFFGYPYKPEFKVGKIYKLRVRPGRFSDRPRYRYFFLEEILEEDVDLSKDDSIYKRALEKFYEDCENFAVEMLVYIRKSMDVSKAMQTTQYNIARSVTGISAVRFADTGLAQMIDGILEIPHDNREHAENKNLKFKEGVIYRIKAKRRTGPNKENYFVLDKVLEENVKDDELKKLAKEALTPGKWHVDGLDEFEVKNAEASGAMLWDKDDDTSIVEIFLTCDTDNPKTASAATAHLMKILEDKEGFEKRVYDAMAGFMADEDGMISTWEGENEGDVTLTKEEFIKRLSLDVIMLNPDGSGYVEVGLDDMFTDHCYLVDINPDGSFEDHGLLG